MWPVHDNVDSLTSSNGSDTTSRAEFKEVKLHAQNQIILSQVLLEEREKVYLYVCMYVGMLSSTVDLLCLLVEQWI